MKVFDRYLWRVVDGIIFIAVFGMVFLIVTQVTTRAIGHSSPWTEELSRFLFIWTTFLGMATGFRQANHPSVEFCVSLFPPSVQRVLRHLTPVCAVVFFGLVGWYGVALLKQQIKFGEISPTLQIGMWVTTLPLVFGSILAPIGVIVNTYYEKHVDQKEEAGVRK